MPFDIDTLIANGAIPDTSEFRALGSSMSLLPLPGVSAAAPPTAADILAQSDITFNGLTDALAQIERSGQQAAEDTRRQIQSSLASAQGDLAQAAAKATSGGGMDVNLMAKGIEQMAKLGATGNFSASALMGPLLNFPGGAALGGMMDKATSAMLAPGGIDFGALAGGDLTNQIGAGALDSLQNGIMGQLMGQLPPGVQAMVGAAQQIAGALGVQMPALGDLLRQKHSPPPAPIPGCYVDKKHIALLMSNVTHPAPAGLAPGPGAANVFWNGHPVWRITSDMHICPLFNGPIPHVPPTGAPVTIGSLTTKACGLPVARVLDFVLEPTGGQNPILGGFAKGAPGENAAARNANQRKADQEAQAKKEAEARAKAAAEAKQADADKPETELEKELADEKAKLKKDEADLERLKNEKPDNSDLPDDLKALLGDKKLSPEQQQDLKYSWEAAKRNFQDPEKWQEFLDKMKDMGGEMLQESVVKAISSLGAGDLKGAIGALISGAAMPLVKDGLNDPSLGLTKEQQQKILNDLAIVEFSTSVTHGIQSETTEAIAEAGKTAAENAAQSGIKKGTILMSPEIQAEIAKHVLEQEALKSAAEHTLNAAIGEKTDTPQDAAVPHTTPQGNNDNYDYVPSDGSTIKNTGTDTGVQLPDIPAPE